MFSNCSALVVEDDAHSLIAIGSLLRDLGIDFKRNTTGRAVAERAEAMQPKPSFVLLDLDLPQGDAFEIVDSFKSKPALADIPVIAMTDDGDLSLSQKTRNAGFSGFLVKPLPRRGFPRLLRRVLDGERVWQTPQRQFNP